MLISKEEITRFIPHRAPFVMIDNLITATEEMFESDFKIREDNLLVEEGEFQETGLIENIAQTCAAAIGYLGNGEEGNAKVGFIGAITRLEVFGLPPVHSTIRTVVKPVGQLGNIYMVKGESFLEGRILLGCEVKIVVTE